MATRNCISKEEEKCMSEYLDLRRILKDRIKIEIPDNMCVVPQTTPVIYFGDYDSARACTISLNPSNLEFVDGKSNELLDKEKERLCSRKKLNKNDNEELTDDEAEIVLKYCTNYFNLNPYKLWFKHLEDFMNCYGNYSYYDGTCVHLDLVQWATREKWSKLDKIDKTLKKRHIDNDWPILEYLLKIKVFEVMFLNTKTVIDTVKERLKIEFKNIKEPPFNKKINIYYGEYNNTKIIGCNVPLSHLGGYEYKKKLCEWIKQNVKY